jgi:hypothetical protein
MDFNPSRFSNPYIDIVKNALNQAFGQQLLGICDTHLQNSCFLLLSSTFSLLSPLFFTIVEFIAEIAG